MATGSGSRRPHKKSRTGCPKCRKRRIKCDEARPQCGNCTRHGVVCDYSTAQSPAPSSSSASTPHASRSSISNAGPPLSASTSIVPPNPPTHSDLILMHHYTRATYLTMSKIPELQHLWQDDVPQIGYRCSYVMNSLLSMAALHLSSLSETNDFLSIAAEHHNAAVRGMGPELANIHSGNCDALFIVSTIVAVYSLYTASLPTMAEVEAKPASWILYLRGVHGILAISYDWVSRGRIAPMVRPYIVCDSLDADADARMTQLYTLCTDRTLPGADELDDTDISAAYFMAISKLRKSYGSTPSAQDAVASVFMWGIGVSDKYMELLNEKRPRALVLWAHYAVLLDQLDYWWSKGIGDWEMLQVARCIPPEWTYWMEWPRKRMRENQERRIRNAEQARLESPLRLETGASEWVTVQASCPGVS